MLIIAILNRRASSSSLLTLCYILVSLIECIITNKCQDLIGPLNLLQFNIRELIDKIGDGIIIGLLELVIAHCCVGRYYHSQMVLEVKANSYSHLSKSVDSY